MDDDVAAIRAFYESAGPDVFKYADALVDEGFDKLPSLPRVPRPLSMHAAPPSPTRGWSVWSQWSRFTGMILVFPIFLIIIHWYWYVVYTSGI
jgi:hypothetical protein